MPHFPPRARPAPHALRARSQGKRGNDVGNDRDVVGGGGDGPVLRRSSAGGEELSETLQDKVRLGVVTMRRYARSSPHPRGWCALCVHRCVFGWLRFVCTQSVVRYGMVWWYDKVRYGKV